MNTYETKTRQALTEILERVLAEHESVEHDHPELLEGLVDELLEFVKDETRQSFINGLRKTQKDSGTGKRPSALSHGKLKPVDKGNGSS